MLINPFRGEDTVFNHLRFDFHGLVRLLQGVRLHFLPSSTACRKILLHFFYCLCFKFCCAFTFCLLVVCLCLNFCPSVGQNNLLALLPISHLLLTLLLFIAFFPYIDLWLFVNKFCLEIVVAYC